MSTNACSSPLCTAVGGVVRNDVRSSHASMRMTPVLPDRRMAAR